MRRCMGTQVHRHDKTMKAVAGAVSSALKSVRLARPWCALQWNRAETVGCNPVET